VTEAYSLGVRPEGRAISPMSVSNDYLVHYLLISTNRL